jgi:hypothetical protein
MTKNIVNTGARDYLIDSARSLPPIVKDDAADLPDGMARGIWAAQAGTINFIDGGGATRTAFPIFAGPNNFLVQRVKTGGATSDSLWAIY